MKPDIKQFIEQARNTGDHFTKLRQIAEDVFFNFPTKTSIQISHKLFTSDIHQARSLAAYLFGMNAAQSKQSLNFLRTHISKDKDWRVQEFLAQAFDRFCSDIGYKQAMPTIKDWLTDSNPNVRRAVTEGLRIWTSRPYFREHPEIAIHLLSRHRSDESEYVRKSIGNALRDISRKHKDLIKAELIKWDISEKTIAQTYKLASKFL
jgi:3-methyladenine DNA glycosylase AlkD